MLLYMQRMDRLLLFLLLRHHHDVSRFRSMVVKEDGRSSTVVQFPLLRLVGVLLLDVAELREEPLSCVWLALF